VEAVGGVIGDIGGAIGDILVPSQGGATRIVLDSISSSVSEGTIIVFTGQLFASNNIGLAGASINIYDDDPIAFDDLIVTGTTDQDGRFRMTWSAKTMDTWPDSSVEIYASFEGTNAYSSSTSIKYTIEIQ